MWTDEVMTICLQKTERGLGFSILDYQALLRSNIRFKRIMDPDLKPDLI